MENTYIKALGQALGQELELTEAGSITLQIDEVPLFLQYRQVENMFQAQMPLGFATSLGRGELFTEMLSANFLGIQTNGAFISYQKDIETLFLEMFIYLHDLDSLGFVQALENFLFNVDDWRSRLESLNNEISEREEENLTKIIEDFASESNPQQNEATFIKV